jgi:hypothetical protein
MFDVGTGVSFSHSRAAAVSNPPIGGYGIGSKLPLRENFIDMVE